MVFRDFKSFQLTRAIFDVCLIISWYILFFIESILLLKSLCPKFWTEKTCKSYISDNTIWIHFSALIPLLIIGFIFCITWKYFQNEKIFKFYKNYMYIRIYLTIFWIGTVINVGEYIFAPFLFFSVFIDLLWIFFNVIYTDSENNNLDKFSLN
eukprot:TRINITY_DN11528_c0_g1_i1.p1 TRINITY_DN11528_c0_g1~~TRINITY_DN11528_c0_g1_i1.p1  ORF type:complete len:153 (-),score=5.48 TRINITY_DN11528_c0_g1_i1:65-523(-)